MAKRSSDGLYRRGGVWWGRRRKFPGGPLVRTSTGCKDLIAARLVKADWERQAADPAYHAANKTSLGEAIVTFLADAKARGCAPDTLEMYEQKCAHLARVLGETTPLRQIVTSSWDAYIKTREAEGANPHTVKKELIRGYGVLKAAKLRGLYPYDLATAMPPYSDRYEPRTRALTLEELFRLGRELRADRLAHVAFVVATGARLKESYRARAGHILPEGYVYLDGTKTKRSKRTIPIAPPLRPFLEFALRNAPGARSDAPTDNSGWPGGPGESRLVRPKSSNLPEDRSASVTSVGASERALFPHWQNALRDLRVACKRAGIAPVTWNDLRRTNATLLEEAGVDASLGAKLLGHVDSRMWETVYGRARPVAQQGILDAAFVGTTATHASVEPRALPAKKADPATVSPGLLSRRSPVRVGPGAPLSSRFHSRNGGESIAGASTEAARGGSVRYIDDTVGERDPKPDKYDLAAAYARVLARRAS